MTKPPAGSEVDVTAEGRQSAGERAGGPGGLPSRWLPTREAKLRSVVALVSGLALLWVLLPGGEAELPEMTVVELAGVPASDVGGPPSPGVLREGEALALSVRTTPGLHMGSVVIDGEGERVSAAAIHRMPRDRDHGSFLRADIAHSLPAAPADYQLLLFGRFREVSADDVEDVVRRSAGSASRRAELASEHEMSVVAVLFRFVRPSRAR